MQVLLAAFMRVYFLHFPYMRPGLYCSILFIQK